MKKIMFIEDESFIGSLMSDYLIKAGFEVDLIPDGTQAVTKLESSDLPNLILLDLTLPGVSGFEILQKVKADPKTKDIPVIIFSNQGDKEEIKKGLRLGAESYFVKANILPQQMIKIVEETLGKETQIDTQK